MHRLMRGAAIAVVALAAACGDDNIPLGIDTTGPTAPGAPGPQAPGGSGPGRIGTGGAGDVASVAIAPASLTLQVGDSVQVIAVALDLSDQPLTGVTFTWASSDTRVVRVREDPTQTGVATATGVGVGTTTITVSVGDVGGAALVAVLPRR